MYIFLKIFFPPMEFM